VTSGPINNSNSINRVRNKELASSLASLLEGLEFPSSKGNIKDHTQHRSQILQQIEGPVIDDDSNILRVIENNLSSDKGILYNSTYELKKLLD